MFMKRIKSKVYGALRGSEKYAKTDMVVLTKEMSWLTIGKIVSMATSLILTYVLANFIPQDVFGNYKFIISIFGIIAAFSLTGLGTIVTQSVSKGFDRTFFEAMRVHLKWGFIMTLISVGVSIYYFIKGNEIFGMAMILVAIASPVMQSQIMFSPYLQGKRNFKDDSIYGFWYTITPAIALIITAFLTDSFLILISVYFISYSLISTILNKIVSKQVDLNTEVDNESIKYGKHLSLMGVLGGISSHLDKVLVFHYIGAVELAIYSIALAIPQQLRNLDRLITTISATRLPKLEIYQIKKVLPRKSFLIFLISLVVAIIYILLAPLFFRIFFPTYLDAVFYSQIYVLIMLLSPVILMKQTLTAHNKTKELYVINSVMPIVKILGLLIFLPIFGMMGAIIAIFVSEIAKVILVTFYYKKLN